MLLSAGRMSWHARGDGYSNLGLWDEAVEFIHDDGANLLSDAAFLVIHRWCVAGSILRRLHFMMVAHLRRQLTLFPLLLLSGIAYACPVCGVGEESTREVYISSTIMLTLMPLFMLGGIGFFIYKKVQEHNRLQWELYQQQHPMQSSSSQ